MSKATASTFPSTAGRYKDLRVSSCLAGLDEPIGPSEPIACYGLFRCSERWVYFSLVFLVVSMPHGAFAQNPSKVTVAYSAVSPIFAGVWMAKEIGAFEKQGLKSDLVYISSGSITVQAMVGGNLDMSIAASNAVVSSILRGAPLVAVGSITNRPAMSLFVQPEITKPEQLQGKTLAITRHGSSTHFLTCFRLKNSACTTKSRFNPWAVRGKSMRQSEPGW